MSDYTVTQCKMTKPSAYGPATQTHVAYIPTSHAIVGRVLDLDLYADGNRSPGWKVIEVYRSSTIGVDEANKRSRDFTRQREASDV